MAGLHLVALHRFGSNNPTGIDTKDAGDTIPFHPYYTVKDLLGLVVFLLVFGWFVFYEPNALLNPDNYIPANPGATPAHIVPEWYLLRNPPINSEQASRRHRHAHLYPCSVRVAVAGHQPSSLGAIQAFVQGVLLGPGRGLRVTDLRWRAAT